MVFADTPSTPPAPPAPGNIPVPPNVPIDGCIIVLAIIAIFIGYYIISKQEHIIRK